MIYDKGKSEVVKTINQKRNKDPSKAKYAEYFKVMNAIKKFPDILFKEINKKHEYSSNEKNYENAQKYAYKTFADHYQVYNSNEYDRFLEFISLNAPDERIKKIQSDLISANWSISKRFLEPIKNWIEIRQLSSKENVQKLYKMNSIFRFIWDRIKARVENSEDPINRKIYTFLKELPDFKPNEKSINKCDEL